MTSTAPVFDAILTSRLSAGEAAWAQTARLEIAGGVSASRIATLLSMASRHTPGSALAPSPEECAMAERALPGWSVERWSVLDAVRIRLLLDHPDLSGVSFAGAVEECFRFADVGETTALYRGLAHFPGGERFVERAREGCRTNMRSVFEAVACDTPFPARHFDDAAWAQLVIKALFVGAPLWRVYGLDERLSPELARMALDLSDERRSAGRPVQHELWLCLGSHGGERGLRALEQEITSAEPRSRRGAALGLARAGATERLRDLLQGERDADVRATIEEALAGRHDQSAFAALDGGSE